MRSYVLRCLTAFLFSGILLLPSLSYPSAAPETRIDESLRKGETRETLDPGQFDDPKVREAYQAAKDIPWVLDSIYCYCYCHESPAFKHISLLSCYVDLHAAG